MRISINRVVPLLFLCVNLALAQFGAPALVLRAPTPQPGDGYGHAIAAGDLNADGTDDLIVSNLNDRVFVYYGKATPGAAADVRLLGPKDSQFGLALATGDFNADGKTDLAVGAPNIDIGQEAFGAGDVRIYSGGSSFSTEPSSTVADSAPADLGNFGSVIIAADVNGDTVSDLIAGSPGRDAVTIYFGGTTFGSRSLTIQGPEIGISFGAALAAGDVNGDGVNDVLVGAPDATVGGNASAGSIFVYFGGESVQRQPDVTITNPDQISEGGLFGATVLLADINGDQKADIIVGAPAATLKGLVGAGKVFAFFGPVTASLGVSVASGASGAREPTPGMTFQEPVVQTASIFGWSLSTGDFNRDGLADLAVAAAGATVGFSVEAGRVYVYFGRGSLRADPDLTLRPQNPAQTGSFGAAILFADVTGDGLADLAIGAPGLTTGRPRPAGQLFLYLGTQIAGAFGSSLRTSVPTAFQRSTAIRYVNG